MASSGSDITLSCSDGSSGLNSPTEFGLQCNDMFLDTKETSVTPNQHRTKWGWPLAASKISITDESINNDGEDDLVYLSRKAEVTDLELQTLRKQITKENKRGQDLLKEVVSLKEENEKLKASQKHKNTSSYEGNPWALLEEMRQELNHEKNLNVNLRLQLQKTQDSNSELILAVQDLEQMLEQCKCSSSEKNIDDDEEQKALEEIVKHHSDVKEAYMREQKIMDLSSEIEMYRRDKDDLEIQMEQLALDYEILKQENHAMSCKLDQSHLRQQLKLQYECSGSYATINELENQVRKLEGELSNSVSTIKELKDELEKQSKKFSYALDTIKEFESQIQTLERELGKNMNGCNSDLDGIIRAKQEQEQRAIRAEEALRLTRWKNANMASRLQDEFKRLSMEMQSTFESNEKVATKAMNEASQLRLMNNQLEELLKQSKEDYDKQLSLNSHLEDLIQQAKKEIQSVKEDYEEQGSDLSKQLSLNSHLEELLQQAKEEIQSVKEDYEAQTSDLKKQLSLNSHLEVLLKQAKEEIQSVKEDYEAQGSDLSKQLSLNSHLEDQLQQAKEELQSVEEDYEEQTSKLNKQLSLNSHLEELLQQANKETQLIKEQLSLKSEEIDQMLVEIKEKSKNELLVLRAEVKRLNAETASLTEHIQQGEELKAEMEQVKELVKEQEREKDNLKCLVESMKKEAENSVEELKLTRSLKDEQEITLQNLQSEMVSLRAQYESEKDKLSKQVVQMKAELQKKDEAIANMEKNLKDSNGRVATAERTKVPSRNIKTELPLPGSKEAASLRVKIKLLEGQMKQREATMETSANAFLQKEKDLNNKVEELERRLQELNHSSMVYYENDNKKNEENHKNEALCNEMASLRKKNSSMEAELKELRERYSEISLKFAEVEGEREQLVMTLRSMKNVKKT